MLKFCTQYCVTVIEPNIIILIITERVSHRKLVELTSNDPRARLLFIILSTLHGTSISPYTENSQMNDWHTQTHTME